MRLGARYWWMFCALGALVFFSYALRPLPRLALRLSGTRASAEILERGVLRGYGHYRWHTDDFVVWVAFSDPLGRRQEASVSLARATWSAVNVGGTVAVVYDPARPTDAVAADGLSQVDRDLFAHAAWGVPLLVLALVLRSRRS